MLVLYLNKFHVLNFFNQNCSSSSVDRFHLESEPREKIVRSLRKYI